MEKLERGYTSKDLNLFMQSCYRSGRRARRTPDGGWEAYDVDVSEKVEIFDTPEPKCRENEEISTHENIHDVVKIDVQKIISDLKERLKQLEEQLQIVEKLPQVSDEPPKIERRQKFMKKIKKWIGL
jgi:hypothetical protein